MAGLVPAIHAFLADLAESRTKDVDARDKRGHDAEEAGCRDVDASSQLLFIPDSSRFFHSLRRRIGPT
jgi:hypothetical protein